MTETGTGRTLRCPNCDGKMREVERRGVVIDICTECRGVFLDRGELDALVEAIEQVDELYARQQQAPPTAPSAPAAPGFQAPQSPPGYTPPPAPGGYQTPQHQGHGYPQQPQHGYQQQPAYGHTPGKKDVVSEAMDLFQAVARERKHKGHSSGYSSHKKHKKGGLADFFDF
jgi:Zn-finger nucleic acid-binding protein